MELNKVRTSWGYRLWWRDMVMAVEMYIHVSLVLSAVWIVMFVLLNWLFYSAYEASLTLNYVKALGLGFLSPSHIMDFNLGGERFQAQAVDLAVSLGKIVRPMLWKTKTAAGLACGVFLLWPTIIGYFRAQAKELSEPKYIQGARFSTINEIKHNVAKQGGGTIGLGADVVIPTKMETEHLFLLGRSGSGKTTIALQVIQSLRSMDAKAVIYDFKGDYLSRFYDPRRDIIFNPLDQRHVGWSVMRELRTHMDIDAIAQSLIPASQSEDSFWHNAARAVFSGSLHNLNISGETRNTAIWQFLHQEGAQVTAALKKTNQPGWKYIEDASSKQAGSVFATLEQFILPIQYMQTTDGDFMINDWLNDPRGGFIFITNYSDIQDTLRPVLSLFVDLIGRRLLSMPDARERRIFFLLDELGSLQRLTTLIRLLTLSRSKGGAVVIGIQDVSQLDRTYTKDHRSTIVNNCGSKIIMNVKDPATAEFCSRTIGDTEVEEPDSSNTVGPSEVREAVSFHRRRQIKPLVMPSVIMHELPSYHFYLLLGGQQILKTKTRIMDHLPKVAPEFLMRPELRLDYIAQQAQRALAEAQATQTEAQKERTSLAQVKTEVDKEVQANLKERRIQEKGAGLDIQEMDF